MQTELIATEFIVAFLNDNCRDVDALTNLTLTIIFIFIMTRLHTFINKVNSITNGLFKD